MTKESTWVDKTLIDAALSAAFVDVLLKFWVLQAGS